MFDFNNIATEIQEGRMCPQCYSPIEDGRCSSNCDILSDWDYLLELEETEKITF